MGSGKTWSWVCQAYGLK